MLFFFAKNVLLKKDKKRVHTVVSHSVVECVACFIDTQARGLPFSTVDRDCSIGSAQSLPVKHHPIARVSAEIRRELLCSTLFFPPR